MPLLHGRAVWREIADVGNFPAAHVVVKGLLPINVLHGFPQGGHFFVQFFSLYGQHLLSLRDGIDAA